MAAQEEMRREIARQMHDGPAQSIANIALQAQVVQQIITRDPRQAEAELRALVGMVQNALEATKNFIFDIRPMVLDDLGPGADPPSLCGAAQPAVRPDRPLRICGRRRTAAERARERPVSYRR